MHVDNWAVTTRLTICKEPEIAIVDNCKLCRIHPVTVPQALCKMFYWYTLLYRKTRSVVTLDQSSCGHHIPL